MLELNAQKHESFVSEQQNRDKKFKSINEALESYTTQKGEINQKLLNNSNQITNVLMANSKLKDEVQITNKRLDGLTERFDILLKCLPQETRTNIEISNSLMDTDPQEE